MSLKAVVLYNVNLSARYRGSGSRVERVLQTGKKHSWSGKRFYALYRGGSSRPIILFVPSASQLAKIKARSGKIQITDKQTESGIGMGWSR